MLGHQAEQLHRVGLVGAGEVVRRFYLPVFRSRADIRVQAICSRDRRRATEVAQLLDIPTVAVDHRALLDDEGIESVIVCTPPHRHFEIASHAFGQGKNVLLEKPPCRKRPSRRTDRNMTVRSCTAPANTTPARIRSVPGR